MRDRTLIATGAVGAAFAALCCMTPLLGVVFGSLGLTAWLTKADYVLMPALIICLGLIGIGPYRRRARQDGAHGQLWGSQAQQVAKRTAHRKSHDF
jgi:mercuric ion transport protein